MHIKFKHDTSSSINSIVIPAKHKRKCTFHISSILVCVL